MLGGELGGSQRECREIGEQINSEKAMTNVQEVEQACLLEEAGPSHPNHPFPLSSEAWLCIPEMWPRWAVGDRSQ